ncbi:MAG TPA: hypothetical protein VH186_16035 [Chloroflexia bacterium]|nr:hypothetical protein [Chloroflexia bacterium]
MLNLLKLQRDLLFVTLGAAFSSADDDSDSIGSESSGSGLSDESCLSSDEASSISSVYSSYESSSPGRGGGYRRGYRDASRRYGPYDYQRIPRRRRF